MLVSPAEPPAFKQLGRSSSLPETLGSDFLIWSPVFGMVGVQRKTVSDLVASLADGRVQREITDMKGCDVGVWMIEGTPEWTTDGQLLGSRTSYRRDQHKIRTLPHLTAVLTRPTCAQRPRALAAATCAHANRDSFHRGDGG